MNKPETLELASLRRRPIFGVQIAFAQDLDRHACTAGADHGEAINFFEEVEFLPRTRYFSWIIGGHFVIPNVQLLRKLADSPLLDGIPESSLRTRELRTRRSETRRRRKSVRRESHKRDGDLLSHR